MIFVIKFSCLSRGPDDQGLSCGPGVIIVRERPVGRRPQANQNQEKREEGVIGASAVLHGGRGWPCA
jgi:hypothetical protein